MHRHFDLLIIALTYSITNGKKFVPLLLRFVHLKNVCYMNTYINYRKKSKDEISAKYDWSKCGNILFDSRLILWYPVMHIFTTFHLWWFGKSFFEQKRHIDSSYLWVASTALATYWRRSRKFANRNPMPWSLTTSLQEISMTFNKKSVTFKDPVSLLTLKSISRKKS